MNTTPGYYDRKPAPRTFPHTGAQDCLCPACLANYRRSHPEKYTVPQARPMNDFTQELNATMKVLGTDTDSNHRAYIKVRTAKRNTYAKAAVILNV